MTAIHIAILQILLLSLLSVLSVLSVRIVCLPVSVLKNRISNYCIVRVHVALVYGA